MEKVIVDCRRLTDREGAHDYLAEIFHFPDYYGRNLDALYDLLTTPPYSEIEIAFSHPEALRDKDSIAAQIVEVLLDV